MSTTPKLMTREEVPVEQTWNAESVFADYDAWEAEFADLQEVMNDVDGFAGSLSQGSYRVADWLDVSSNISRRLSKLYFYAMMSVSVNSSNIDAKKLQGKIAGLVGRWAGLSAFYEPEILEIGKDTITQWVQADDRLKVYKHHFEDLFRTAEHIRSSEVENVLGQVREPFGATSTAASELTGTDLTFDDATDSSGESYPVTQSSWFTHIQSEDRKLRQSTWESYADGYLGMQNTLASLYTASVKQTIFNVRVRGYDNALESRLYPYNLPEDVFHNLIDTFKKNLPVWHKYWEIKRKALGYDSIHPYDIWAPIVQDQTEVPYEQSVDWISEGMQPLGNDYVDALRRGCLEQRWVDYSMNRGKRQGAFSGGTYDTYPFIMMSYDYNLKSMSTLAHELGHSLHSYYSRKTQPYVYSGYSMFVAEVASNFNQALTRAYLFKEKADDTNFQIALIEEAMVNFHRYFFIMPTLARFEYEVHQRAQAGQPLTADILNNLMSDLYAEGYGDTMSDDKDRTGITWAQFQHLYVPFYTFQYATGISAAHALADRVLNGGEAEAADYRKFLSTGSAEYPMDALKIAGVDMSTPEPVEKTFVIMGDMIDRLAELTGSQS